MLCIAVTVEIFTPPTVTVPPKRASIESDGWPPFARSLAEKNAAISLPVTIFAFLAIAMFTALEFGIAETDMSGLSQKAPRKGRIVPQALRPI